MDQTEFLGVYHALPRSKDMGIPEHAEGLWQVWRIADGDYMAQPIDKEMNSCGEQYFILADNFPHCFQKKLIQLDGEVADDVVVVSASAPDLLDYWHSQLTNDTFGVELERLPAVSMADSLLTAENNAQLERQFHPYAPDKLQFEQFDSFADSDEMESAEELEKYMREEFSRLIELIGTEQEYAALKRLEEIISVNANFTSQQTIMFSEFGLILRKERQTRLALMSHLRALDCSPDDEHVMFNIARIEYEMGNSAGAKRRLERALSQDANFTAAKTFLDFLRGQNKQ